MFQHKQKYVPLVLTWDLGFEFTSLMPVLTFARSPTLVQIFLYEFSAIVPLGWIQRALRHSLVAKVIHTLKSQSPISMPVNAVVSPGPVNQSSVQ